MTHVMTTNEVMNPIRILTVDELKQKQKTLTSRVWHFDKNKQKSIFKMAFKLIFVFGYTSHPTPNTETIVFRDFRCFPNLARTYVGFSVVIIV